MHWVVCERGAEFERQTTFKRDDLLYWVFEDVTHELASHYELRHRVPHQDFRLLRFSRQLELLGHLKADWRRRIVELGPLLAEVGLDPS